MSRYAPLLLLLVLPLVAAPGCGEAGSPTVFKSVGEATPGAAAPAPGGKPAADAPAEPAVARKIIYTATVEVVVKNLDDARTRVERLAADTGGYVAKSEVSGTAGSRRTASWVLKVPADKFRDTVNALAAVGVLVRNAADSQDVTEEFIDLQARLKNLRVEEEALNKLLKDAPNVDAVLKVREQVSKVRGDIERAEGRLKYLTTMTALSTITFVAREEENYVPPTAPEPPTFGSQIRETLNNSLDALERFGRAVVLVVVAVAPWLPFILVGALLLRWGILRLAAAIDPPMPSRRPRPTPAPAAIPAAADPAPAPSADRPE